MEGVVFKASIAALMEVGFLFCNFWSSESLDGAPSSLLDVLVIVCVCVCDSVYVRKRIKITLSLSKEHPLSLSLSKSELGTKEGDKLNVYLGIPVMHTHIYTLSRS